MTIKHIALVFLVLAVTGGCSNEAAKSRARSIPASAYKMKSPPPYKEQDVRFAQGVYAYQSQALVVTEMAMTRAHSPEVRQLTTGLRTLQRSNTRASNAWLIEWKKAVPSATSAKDTSTPNHPAISSAELAQLNNLSGSRYDRRVLQLLIRTHQGLVQLAGRELHAGSFAPARQMAAQVNVGGIGLIVNMQTLIQRFR